MWVSPAKLGSSFDRPLLIVAVCGSLLAVHLILRFLGNKWVDGLDVIALGLTLVGLSPWIATVLDSTKFGGVEVRFREIRSQVESQRSDIDILKFLIGHFLSRDELGLLTKLASQDSYEIDVGVFATEFQSDLRHLRGLGFIDNHEGKGVRAMYQLDPTTAKRDVRQYFFVTESGRKFLRLRSDVT